jgi:hypothetical protein
MHARIERFYNGLVVGRDRGVEWSFFLAYHREIVVARGWLLYRFEWMVFDYSLLLSGSVDGIYCYPQADGVTPDLQRIVLNDWKRSQELKSESFRGETAKGIASCLQKCNKEKYEAQLNWYKWLLEERYGVHVVEMYITVFHPEESRYLLTEVRDLQPLIRAMVAERRVVVAPFLASSEAAVTAIPF